MTRCGLALVAGLAASACAEDTLLTIGTTTDEFTQNDAASVDVLWVVDNSQSMQEEQTGLGQSFAVFLQQFELSQIDFHIGVVSTDTATNGVLHAPAGNPKYITAATPDPTGTFLENVCFGTVSLGSCQASAGASNEKAFESAALALGKGGSWAPGDPVTPPNPGFLRAGAALFVIMVSDEDDHSFGPVGYYYRLFDSYKGAGNESRVSVSAIAGPTAGDAGCVSVRGSAVPGYRYEELAAESGGVFTSLCEDFGLSLANLSSRAAGLRDRFVLSAPVKTGTKVPCGKVDAAELCVEVHHPALPSGGGAVGKDASDGWSFEASSNTVIFHGTKVPPPLATISVEYEARP
jgi:hypothetical protein